MDDLRDAIELIFPSCDNHYSQRLVGSWVTAASEADNDDDDDNVEPRGGWFGCWIE